tara:strand:- start:751 stop:1053 length:303 start_codon:yes stop_codon:yes gene_type:complete
MNKHWTIEEIRALIAENDKAVARGILAIYGKQTAMEQMVGETSASNGVGFSGADAPFLSSLALFYQAKGFLSPKQVEIGRKRITKYARQLTDIANTPVAV